MIESLNDRLTEVKENIRYKQKLEKDLLQIRESLAAERVKYAFGTMMDYWNSSARFLFLSLKNISFRN